LARKRRAVKADPLSEPEHEFARLDPVQRDGTLDDRDRLVGAAAELELPGDDPAGQQSMIAFTCATVARA